MDTDHHVIGLGGSQCTLLDMPGGSNDVYFHSFVTDPEHQGKGHGQQLLLALLARADEMGTTLHTHAPDDTTRRGLIGTGFEPEREDPNGWTLMARPPGATIPDRCPITGESMDELSSRIKHLV